MDFPSLFRNHDIDERSPSVSGRVVTALQGGDQFIRAFPPFAVAAKGFNHLYVVRPLDVGPEIAVFLDRGTFGIEPLVHVLHSSIFSVVENDHHNRQVEIARSAKALQNGVIEKSAVTDKSDDSTIGV